MDNFLLPPTVIGPISTISSSIQVVGQIPNTTIQLFADGQPLGLPQVSTGATSIMIQLGTDRAKYNQAITAVQIFADSTSQPSPIPVIVNDVSNPLPTPIILSIIHNKIDWVTIGGVIPGSTITIKHNGNTIGQTETDSDYLSVRVTFLTGALSVNDHITVIQQAVVSGGVTISSFEAISLPVIGFGRHDQIATPTIARPPLKCDTGVLVSGLLDGSTLVLTQGSGSGEYGFISSTVTAITDPLPTPDNISVRQEFQNFQLSSPDSVPMPVGMEAPEAPFIFSPICPDGNSVKISNLREGNTVALTVYAKHENGIVLGKQLGSAGAWATTCDIQLTPGWADNLPDAGQSPITELYLSAIAGGCTSVSAYSNEAKIDKIFSTGVQAPKIPYKLYRCASKVMVNNITPGALISLVSDQIDGNLVTPAIRVYSTSAEIQCNRVLRDGENVTAVMSGCGTFELSSNPSKVEIFNKDLLPPMINKPLRATNTGVSISNIVPGATVIISVNGFPRTQVEIADTSAWIGVGVLHVNDIVTAKQKLCSLISPLSSATVTSALLNLKHTPNPLYKGVNQSFKIHATDSDTDAVVSGYFQINGSGDTHFTDQQLNYNFPEASGPNVIVKAVNYADANVVWHLVAEQVLGTATLSLSNGNIPGVNIQKVVWSMGQVGGVQTEYNNPPSSGSNWSMSETLPTPNSGVVQYNVKCKVTLDYNGQRVVTTESQLQIIGWIGKKLTVGFVLVSSFDNNGILQFGVGYLGAS